MVKCDTNPRVSMAVKQTKQAPSYNCPVEATLDVIGGKWKALILFHLRDAVLRFGELRRQIPGVSERMLAQQLRELEEQGVVHREVYREVPPKVEYWLTDYGKTLRPITDLLCAWGKKHQRRLAGEDAGRDREPSRLPEKSPLRRLPPNRGRPRGGRLRGCGLQEKRLDQRDGRTRAYRPDGVGRAGLAAGHALQRGRCRHHH